MGMRFRGRHDAAHDEYSEEEYETGWDTICDPAWPIHEGGLLSFTRADGRKVSLVVASVKAPDKEWTYRRVVIAVVDDDGRVLTVHLGTRRRTHPGRQTCRAVLAC